MNRPDLGVLASPALGNAPSLWGHLPWGGDNGCFSQGASFDESRWLAWLARMRPWQATCLFAVAPDVVADAAATLARSAPLLPVLRRLGYPAAFVAQDGLERLPVPWETFDALFIGGSTCWKLSEAAHELGVEAKARGKWLHWGRVNSFARLRQAALSGADSVDGTYLAFGPDVNLPRMTRWLDDLWRQPSLLGETVGREERG